MIFGFLGVIIPKRFVCPKCKSTESIWKGYRYNKSGKKRKRKCLKCNTYFTPNDGFLRMRFKKEVIIEAVGLFIAGLSLSRVKNHMWQHHNVKISRPIILYWVDKFSKILQEFVDQLKPTIKGISHADEVFLKVKGNQVYYWGMKDRKTKFKISAKLTDKREYKGAKSLFHKLKYGCNGIPEKIITDKLAHYKKAYRSYFYRQRGSCKLIHGVPIACKKYGLKYNNNCSERDNERIKQRYKTMRGFGNFDSAETILALMDICYNFVDPNMSLKGGTPAEEADLDLNLKRNKLRSLIKKAIYFLNT